MLKHLKAFWSSNWTSTWGAIKLAAAGIGSSLYFLGNLIDNGSVKSAIDSLHLDPKLMLALAILGAITVISTEH